MQLTDAPTTKVDPLSGGMKRRLTIARSLVNEPELLLLDEPTTGLDPQARHVLWDRLYRLKQQGVTLVLTTHYMDEAEQLCDRLVVMDKARIVAEGSPRELIAAHSSREVVELRFAPGRARGDGRASWRDLAERVEVLPDRVLLYTDDGDAAAAAVHDRGPAPGERAGAPQHAGGRLPPPHRPDAGRLMADRRRPRSPCARSNTRLRSSTGAPGAARWSARSSTRCCSWSPWGSASARWSTTSRRRRSTASRYLSFLAPGLLAATAMQTARRRVDLAGDGRDQVDQDLPRHAGHPARRARRARRPPALDRRSGCSSPASIFLAVMAAVRRRGSRRWALLALPAAVLTGLAFAAPIVASRGHSRTTRLRRR